MKFGGWGDEKKEEEIAMNILSGKQNVPIS